MTQANYKSTRLLVEAINQEMETIRKAAMGNMALGPLNDLRDLVAQLAEKAGRVAVDDLSSMTPGAYVAAMRPLVTTFHRQLMHFDKLPACICEDLEAGACVIILVGDGKTVVRTAHDPERPEAALLVETILAQLDDGAKKVAEDVAAAGERFAGIDQAVLAEVGDRDGSG